MTDLVPDALSAFVFLFGLVVVTYISLTRGTPVIVCLMALQTVVMATLTYATDSTIGQWVATGTFVLAIVGINWRDMRRFRRDLREITARMEAHVWSFVDGHHDLLTRMEVRGDMTGAQADLARENVNKLAAAMLGSRPW